ncbi:MSMEG_4193 family putative phosphomutase [Gordonia neofelifaecis]|uniref:Phosphoglycerate mutase n=1 Tax=Gordonia neofelifaecis NRRL B-59395 TaxID=644548 RepID=F1YGN0_9ACTN|nr:MSMEG_4193 family putative phosphomutase [Gordonia neofelifaecis]EGD56178.1 phosphoglycerate mutase [Gordonia neofelifaecis NRRL B-59395]
MTVILVRHGRSTANTSGLLAGRTPGVGLDDRGRAQAEELPQRLDGVLADLTAVVRSPLQRCAETVEPLVSARPELPHITEPNLEEVDYGDWSNRKIAELLAEPLWKVVQQQPSAAVFPGGEGLLDVSRRATAAVRELDRVHGGPDGKGLWVACSHGDVIKAVLADALGMHLDQFQRIVVDPGSISVIHYGSARPYVQTVNNSGALELPRPPMAAGATVGGSTGT